MTTVLDVQGRRTILYRTNKSGGAVAYGDVVVGDSSNDSAFTTTTTAGLISAWVGVCIEVNGIANNVAGRIAVQGEVAQVNLNASGTRGHFIKTHTVAKQATDAGASRVTGVFAVLDSTGSTPAATLFGMPDGSTGAAGSPATPALTLGTSNAIGAASTLIASDATIAAFDATVPVTQALGDAAAAGSAGVAARRDHKHAMPATTAVPGGELDYVEKTTNTTLSATTEGTATTIITSSSITFDGSPVILTFYSPGIKCQGTANADYTILLRDDTGAAVLGDIAYGVTPAANENYRPVLVQCRFTPAAGARTYSIRGFSATNSPVVLGGARGTGNTMMPAFLRFQKV